MVVYVYHLARSARMLKQTDANKKIIQIKKQSVLALVSHGLFVFLSERVSFSRVLLRWPLIYVQYPQNDLLVCLPLIKVFIHTVQICRVYHLYCAIVKFKILVFFFLCLVVFLLLPWTLFYDSGSTSSPSDRCGQPSTCLWWCVTSFSWCQTGLSVSLCLCLIIANMLFCQSSASKETTTAEGSQSVEGRGWLFASWEEGFS